MNERPPTLPIARLILVFLLSLTAGCSRLGAFDAVIPKDSGSHLAASDIAYGDQPRQKLDVYMPDSAARGTVVFVYGGSWNSGDKSDYGFVGKALASRGYATVILDYRLVPDVRYPVFVQDTAAAIAWASRNMASLGVKPRKLYVVGHSAGAYNAMMVAIAPEFLAREGLSTAALSGAVGLSGPYDFLPLDVDETREAFAGIKDLKRTQPVDRVVRATPIAPAFLATGDADTLVMPRNTYALASRLRAAGKSVQSKTYPGVDHTGTLLAIAKPLRDRAPVLDDVVSFLDAH